jgi:alkylation response protein AidB-like acyl-CoA dehydrogenase
MHFAFTQEQSMLADTARSFFARNAISERTRQAMAGDGVDHALWRSFVDDLGLGGLIAPEADGGVGLGMVELAIVAEAAGAHVAALPLLGSLAMATPALVAASAGEPLRELIEGRAVAAVGFFGDLRREANTLCGVVDFIPHGATADLLVLLGDDQAWLVPTHAEGLSIQPLTTLDQTRPYARVTLDGAMAQPLANPQAATDAARTGGWICLAAEALGGAQACLDRTVAYAKARIQFGRPIGSFQAIKHRLADMMVEIEQARSAVYWAACAVDEGLDEARLAVHAAKAFAADAYVMCAGAMIQLHGGIGFTWDHDAHLFFKRAQAISSMLGSSNWHREAVARLIGLEAAA